MIIKKYVAANVKEAVQALKEDLGPEAIVLTTRRVPATGPLAWFFGQPKVEVTGGVDGKDKKKADKSAASQEVDPLADLKAALNQIPLEGGREVGLEPRKRVAAPASTSTQSYNARGKKVVEESAVENPGLEKPDMAEAEQSLKRLVAHFAESAEEVPAAPKETATDTEGIRQVIREEMQRAQKSVSVGRIDGGDENEVGSVRFLISKGVPRSLALKIEERLDQQLGVVDMSRAGAGRSQRLNRMKQELAKSLKTTGPILMRQGQCTVVAIVGPTGVGKTTTLGKIASEYSETLGKKVGILSLDTVKIGAREQIQALATELNLPLAIARDAKEFHQELEAAKDLDLLLIDTAGQSLYKSGEVEKLNALVSTLPNLQVFLAVSSATKDVDIFGAIKQFSIFQLKGIIFTKTDETIQHGVLIHACQKSGIPVAYLTTGQSIRGDLEVADAQKIAKSILVQNNEATWRDLRQLAGA